MNKGAFAHGWSTRRAVPHGVAAPDVQAGAGGRRGGGQAVIGWTTGDPGGKRYDLSKRLSDIVATRVLKIHPASLPTTKPVKPSSMGSMRPLKETLPDLVGKDLAAQKIIANPARRVLRFRPRLKVGSEGHEGLYDTILPKEISKYVKQWGAGVVKGKCARKRNCL